MRILAWWAHGGLVVWWAGGCMVGWWWASFDKISLIGGPVPLLCLSIIAFLDQLLGVWSLDMNQQDVWKFFAIARRALIVLLGWNYDVPTGRVGI